RVDLVEVVEQRLEAVVVGRAPAAAGGDLPPRARRGRVRVRHVHDRQARGAAGGHVPVGVDRGREWGGGGLVLQRDGSAEGGRGAATRRCCPRRRRART